MEGTVDKGKRQTGRGYLQHIRQGLVSRIYKDSLQFNKKKKKNPIKNAQKLLTGDSQKMKFK